MRIVSTLLLVAALLTAGCIHADHDVRVAPIQVEPIHVTVDVSVEVTHRPAEPTDPSAEAPQPER